MWIHYYSPESEKEHYKICILYYIVLFISKKRKKKFSLPSLALSIQPKSGSVILEHQTCLYTHSGGTSSC